MNRTIILAPGWGEDSETFKPLIQVLNERNYRVITVLQRSHDARNVMHDRMLAILATVKQERVPGVQLVLVGHSLGGIDAMLAANDPEGLVDHLILVSPAGLVEPLSLRELIIRFARKMSHDTPRMMRIAGVNTLRRPVAAFVEAKSAGSIATMPVLVPYAQHKSVDVVATSEDLLFYSHDMIRVFRTSQIEHILTVVPGLHDAIHLEAERFGGLIDEMTSRALNAAGTTKLPLPRSH